MKSIFLSCAAVALMAFSSSWVWSQQISSSKQAVGTEAERLAAIA